MEYIIVIKDERDKGPGPWQVKAKVYSSNFVNGATARSTDPIEVLRVLASTIERLNNRQALLSDIDLEENP